MTEALEVVVEALLSYWVSPITLMVLAVCGACMGTLSYVFLANSRNAKLRVSILNGFYGLTVFFWIFVAASLALCISQAPMVAYEERGIQIAAAGAVGVALVASVILSLIVWRYGSASVLRRFAPRDPQENETWIQKYSDLLADFEGVPRVRVGIVESDEHLAMAVGGPQPRILVSRGMLAILDRDEVETVIAHELMHVKHHDTGFKVFSTVLSRVLFFDPFSKFFDPAVHREREYLADEMGARTSGKPAALASALLKITEHGLPPKAAWGLSILGRGRGIFSRYPPLRERVHRLLLLSDLLTVDPYRAKSVRP